MSDGPSTSRREAVARALRAAQEGDLPPRPTSLAVADEVVRLLLVVDEPIFREGLLRLLAPLAHVRVAAWSDHAQAVSLLAQEHSIDVLLVCLQDEDAGPSLARQLPHLPVVTLVAAPSRDYVAAAVDSGVLSVLDRGSDVVDIVAAVRAVRHGLVVHSALLRNGHDEPPSEVEVATTTQQPPVPDPVPAVTSDAPPVTVLTKRESEIVQLLVDGYSIKQVASRLGIAMQTAKNHVHNIMTKVGASTRVQLCSWAREHGIQESRPLLNGNHREGAEH